MMQWKQWAWCLLPLLTGCSLTLGELPAQITLRVEAPASVSAPASAVVSDGRMLVAETAVIVVRLSSPGIEDTRASYPLPPPVNGVRTLTVSLKTIPGQHSLSVTSLDSANRVLAYAGVVTAFVSGPNSVSLAMRPPVSIASGAVYPLSMGQVSYYTVPASLGKVVQFTAADTTFWECGPDGSPITAGNAGSFSIDASDGNDHYLRAMQGVTNDGFTALVAGMALNITLDFSYPGAPIVNLPAQAALARNYNQQATVDPELFNFPTLYGLNWTIDGQASYPDTTPLSYDAAYVVTVESSRLSVGTHELVFYLTDGAHVYSASITFRVLGGL